MSLIEAVDFQAALQDHPTPLTEARRAELVELSTFLAEALPVVNDVQQVNARLTKLNRDDVLINERAQMDPHTGLEDFVGKNNTTTNNFRFRMQISVFTERNPYRENQKLTDSKRGITEDELLGLIDGSFELGKADMLSNFAVKPVFIRLLACFPDFTTKLVTTISGPEKGPDVLEQYAPELFVAYQLMSKLVDINDPDVLHPELAPADFISEQGARMTYLTN